MEYIESMALKDMAESLVDKYGLYIGHVNINNIFFASIYGDKPKKAPVIFLSGIGSQWVKQVVEKVPDGTLYCIAIWQDEWDELWPAKQEWFLFDCLLGIGHENDGKILKHDCDEWAIIVEYLGPYWRIKDDVALPSLLEPSMPLPLPMPLFDVEEDE